MIELLAVGIAVFALSALTSLHMRTVRARAAAWDGAARQLGLAPGSARADILGGARFAGELDGFRVEVEALRGEKSHRRLRVVVDGLGRISPRLGLRPEGLVSALAHTLGRHDVETGDEDFDQAVLVEGNPQLLSALLDLDTRRRVRWLVATGLRVEGGRLVSGHGEDTDDPRALAAKARELLELATRLVEPASPVERLAANVRMDTVAGVRRLCFERLVERFPKHPETVEVARELLQHPDAELRLASARHLGEDGHDTLLGLTQLAGSDDYLAAMAVAALGAALPLGRAAELLSLACARGSMGLAGAVVEALGANGSEGAVRWLVELLRGHNVDLAAVAARALGAQGGAAMEDDLLAALSRGVPELSLAAAQALGFVGTAASVPTLRALSVSDSSGRDLQRMSAWAVVAIQSRLAGAAPGQLALTDAEPGGLSLAAAEGGALSLPEIRRKPEE
ncbi:MAG: HEAT repeat domain-containing protein [Thermoanaerobaculaceae bacterium]